jgi:hypothetical protein
MRERESERESERENELILVHGCLDEREGERETKRERGRGKDLLSS